METTVEVKDFEPKEHLKTLSIEQLKELADKLWEERKIVWQVIDEKKAEQFDIDYVGKYLCVENEWMSGLTYIHVERQFHEISDGVITLYLRGNSFKSNFSSYRDSTYFEYDQWLQVEIDASKINRKVNIITKEEFVNKFKETLNRISVEFDEIEDNGNKDNLYK